VKHAALSVRDYPTATAIAHVVRSAKKLGVDVAGVEVSPDGTIRVVDARVAKPPPATLFDELEQQGKL
jgi:hypothetical protein